MLRCFWSLWGRRFGTLQLGQGRGPRFSVLRKRDVCAVPLDAVDDSRVLVPVSPHGQAFGAHAPLNGGALCSLQGRERNRCLFVVLRELHTRLAVVEDFEYDSWVEVAIAPRGGAFVPLTKGSGARRGGPLK